MKTKAELFKTSCPDAALLFKYSKGSLNSESVYQVEHHLISCSLCRDALEGMNMMTVADGMRQVSKKNPYSSTNYGWWWAGGIVLMIAVILYLRESPEPSTLSKEEQKAVFREELPTITKPEAAGVDAIATLEEKLNRETIILNNDTVIHQPSLTEPEKLAIQDADSSETIVNKTEGKTVEPRFAMPVKYLYDLKVIDYSELYEWIDKKGKGVLKGLPANKEKAGEDPLTAAQNDTITSESVLNQAMSLFSKGNFSGAIDEFKKIFEVFPDDLNAEFYSGIAYYKLAEYDKTISLLRKVIEHRNNVFTEEAEWYLTLSMINDGNESEAVTMLQKIVDQQGFYSEKAAAKLKSLQ